MCNVQFKTSGQGWNKWKVRGKSKKAVNSKNSVKKKKIVKKKEAKNIQCNEMDRGKD